VRELAERLIDSRRGCCDAAAHAGGVIQKLAARSNAGATRFGQARKITFGGIMIVLQAEQRTVIE
jgi:hypothetical protein